MSGIKFITAIYGEDYLPLLAPHLYTVRDKHPDAEELVLWQNLLPREIALLSLAFPHCRYMQIEESIEGNAHQKVSRKTLCWRDACRQYPNDMLCFIDCDTLIVRPIDKFLTDDFDLIFTWKDEPFPLNTGVVIVRDGRTGEAFFNEWAARTERIVADPAALSFACGVSGGADQHSFRELMGFTNYDGRFRRKVAGRDFVFKGVPCQFLNETNSVPITEDTHIIHYKGGWQPIILRGQDFSESRPEHQGREMYDLWMNTSTQAKQYVAKHVVKHAASQCLARFKQLIDTYEKRGILHSEMLAICAVCDQLDVEVIIESGRARGQSTYTLAKYFKDRPVKIISIDWKGSSYFNEEDDAFARERLASFQKVDILYGNSSRIMPRLLGKLEGKRVALLLDGPKGQGAVDLLSTLTAEHSNIVVAFLHDTMKGTPQRHSLENTFARVFFTDDEEYVKSYDELDNSCTKQGHWRPYWNKSYGQIKSYGPTLSVVFPVASELASLKSTTKNSLRLPIKKLLSAGTLLAHWLKRSIGKT
jgi:hypothetical protein